MARREREQNKWLKLADWIAVKFIICDWEITTTNICKQNTPGQVFLPRTAAADENSIYAYEGVT